MTRLEETLEGLTNLNVDVAEENGNVVFLHKIVNGSASRSYGIHVAKLAGAPGELLERAEEILSGLENDGSDIICPAERKTSSEAKTESLEAQEIQLSLFSSIPDPVIDKIKSIDLMNTTPSQALKILEEIKEQL